jgi:YgiT-type zinc finger domain-containing protein
MDECLICGSTHFTEQRVNKVFEIDGKPVFVQNIPAYICNNCGEKYFSGSTHDKIMKMVYNDKFVSETVSAKSYHFV